MIDLPIRGEIIHAIRVRAKSPNSQIAKCICPKLQNAFVSNCKLYFSQIAKCICLKLPIKGEIIHTIRVRAKSPKFSNCKMYLSQFSNCICLKLQTIFVSNRKLYLCHITKQGGEYPHKCICPKLQTVFVSNYKLYLSQIANCIRVKLPNRGEIIHALRGCAKLSSI